MPRIVATIGLLVLSLVLGCQAEPDQTAPPVTSVPPSIKTEPSIRIDHNPALSLGKQLLRLYNIECTGIGLVEAELIAVIDGQPHKLITVKAKPERDGVSRGQLLVLAPNDRAVPVDVMLTFGGRPNSYIVHSDWPSLPAELPVADAGTSGILDKRTTVIHGRGLTDSIAATESLKPPDQPGPDRLLITVRWEVATENSP